MPAEDASLLPDPRGSIVTVGTFDGVHRGHRHVLDRLTAKARAAGLASALVSFDPHPLDVVRPGAAPLLLTTGEERAEVLATTEIDYVVVLRFTPALARLSAEQFVDGVLRPRLGMRELLVGYDHGFGRGRAGDADTLRRIGESRGFAVELVDAVTGPHGMPVSSSRIRGALAEGDLPSAAAALGRRYSISGRVVAGMRRGRAIGYPTINVVPPPRKLLPVHGVYAVRVETPAGVHGGMLNLGPKPTFGDASVTLEAHLFDIAADLYDAPVRLEFVARLRDVRRFDSPGALAVQLQADERQARTALGALTQPL